MPKPVVPSFFGKADEPFVKRMRACEAFVFIQSRKRDRHD